MNGSPVSNIFKFFISIKIFPSSGNKFVYEKAAPVARIFRPISFAARTYMPRQKNNIQYLQFWENTKQSMLGH